MLRVYGCITQQHNLWLVLLAAVICLLACYTTFSLGGRLRSRGRNAWVAGAAVVTGSGVWATHFVAMLAFKPGLPINYDVGITMLSVVVAIAFSAAGFHVARRQGGALGGAIVGLGVGAMHYTGMAALEAPALKHWDGLYVAASLVIGVGLGALAVGIAVHRSGLAARISAGSLLALGIVGLHFTAMSAFSLEPDPRVVFSGGVQAQQWLAVSIAAVTVLIVVLGLVGSLVDEHLAGRTAREAERLRQHVAELEATKIELEAATGQLRMALSEAAAASQAKSQFLATMGHELRTPLNAIIGFAELQVREIYGPLGDERYKEYSAEIFNSGSHLLELINDILDFTNLDGGRLELAEEPVDLADMAAKLARQMAPQAEAAKVGLEFECPDDAPLLQADPLRLRQILANLLSNAVKFTPAGGRVRLAVAHGPDGVAIAVTDTGIGMAREDIPTALERFGQIDSRLSRKYEGTGLGLPLAKSLTERHGGALAIESAVGAGTTVTVTLPPDRVISTTRAA